MNEGRPDAKILFIRHFSWLRRQSFQHPASSFPAVVNPVVQAAGAALPEFQGVGYEPKTSPVRRARHRLIGKLHFEVALPGFEYVAVRNNTTLVRYPRANLTPARAATALASRYR